MRVSWVVLSRNSKKVLFPPHFLPVPKHAWLLIAGIIAPISLLLRIDKLTKG